MAYPTTIPVVSDMLHCQIPIELGGDFLDEIVGVWWAFSVGIVAQNLLIGLNPSRHKKKHKQRDLDHIHCFDNHDHCLTLISLYQLQEKCQVTPVHVGGVREYLFPDLLIMITLEGECRKM